jgi:hypothetical protein
MNPTIPLLANRRTAVTALLALLALTMLIALPTVAAQVVTVETNKEIYVPGDAMVVSGTATPDAAVTIQVYNPSGALSAVAQTTSNSAGNYEKLVLTFPSEPTDLYPLGDYTVKAYSTAKTAEKTVEFASEAAPPVLIGPIAISMDVGDIYFPGETASGYALTAVKDVPVDVSIMFTLYMPDGRKTTLTPTTVSTGLYRADYKLSTTAPEGAYALVAEASNAGYHAVSVESFQVSPTLTDWNAIKDDVSEIDAKLVSLSGTVATISSTVGDFKADVDDLGLKVTAIDGDIATMSSSLGTLTGTVESIEGDVATVKTELGTVKADLSAAKADLSTVKADVSSVKAEFPIEIPAVDLSPIWIAVVLSLIAAVAAIASFVTISRRIA